MVIGVFVLVLMGAISASFYTVERSAAVTAVAAGARAAATASPTDPNQPNLAAAQAAVTQVANNAMFGTTVTVVVQQIANSPCAAGGNGQVTVCVERVTDTAGQLDMVSVHMVGTPHNPVPTFGIFNWSLDVEARVHQVTFLA